MNPTRLILILSALCILATPGLDACWAFVPFEQFFEESESVTRLKVVGIERAEDRSIQAIDPFGRPYDFAVCEVVENLYGQFIPGDDGKYRISSHNDRKGARVSTDVGYEVGDEITLIARSHRKSPSIGVYYFGGGHPDCRTSEKELGRHKQVIDRFITRSKERLTRLSAQMPDAARTAHAVLEGIRTSARASLDDVSAEACLLLQEIAAVSGMRHLLAECKARQRTLLESERLGQEVLCALVGLTESAANTAKTLLNFDGQSAMEMLCLNVKCDAPKVIQVVTKLCEAGELGTALAWFATHALWNTFPWHLLSPAWEFGDQGRVAVLSVLVLMSSRTHWAQESQQALKHLEFLAPDCGDDYPYKTPSSRALAWLLDHSPIAAAPFVDGEQGPDEIWEAIDSGSGEWTVQQWNSITKHQAALEMAYISGWPLFCQCTRMAYANRNNWTDPTNSKVALASLRANLAKHGIEARLESFEDMAMLVKERAERELARPEPDQEKSAEARESPR